MPAARIVIVLACLLIAAGPHAVGANVVVVCPADFREALGRWVDHRRGDGLEVTVIDSDHDATKLLAAIQSASDGDTHYVVLVGDSPVFGRPCNARRQVPILYAPTSVTKQWGSTPTLASDLSYGDFNRDGLPDGVVGRLPVDTPDQLRKLIERIIARESSDDFGPWRTRVQLVGGVGGFGPVIDRSIESVTRTIVSGVLPTETRMSIAYASPGHAFYPKGPFTDAVIDRYQHGARFWVYAGHGQITELDRVPRTNAGIPVLDARSVRRLSRPAEASPIAVLLACYSGAVDAPEDSIAEEMIRCEGGPIAVLAGSRVTMPYGNTTAAVGLINAVYEQKLPRLGDAWLSALVAMHRESSSDQPTAARMMIDALATVVSPPGTVLVDERREHMLLYSLLGDPTLKLNHPLPMTLAVAPGHDSGEAIAVQLESPVSGEITLTLDRPLGTLIEGDPNDTSVASTLGRIESGRHMTTQILVPAGVTGPIVVRALVAGKTSWASAAARTMVRK